MSQDRERLRRLMSIATLVSDARSQTLRRENEVRDGLYQQLLALNTDAKQEDLPWPGTEKAMFWYEQWAAKRRAEINLRLAAQTVVCLQASDDSKLAFGRKIAVERIAMARMRSQLS